MVCEGKRSAVITVGIVRWDPVFFSGNTVPKRNIQEFSMALIEDRFGPSKHHGKAILIPSASSDSVEY